MPFIVTESCIKCKYTDCVEVCPVDCFHEGPNMLVIDPDECIDCTLCEPECPVEAIMADEDVPEEMVRWVFKSKNTSSLEDIAIAHAYFIAIHPFGDGNGRVGRALVMAQCLNARLMPPVLNKENRAMYFAAMEHALIHGRYTPLTRLFQEAANVA